MTCPTPAKRRYATVTGAHAEARRELLAVGCLLTPYACPCGWIHLTSQPQVDPRAIANPAIVNQLRHGSHDTFVAAVEADAAGYADYDLRVALRAPRLHGRWVTALRSIAARLDRQLAAAPAAGDWRQRAEVFRHNIANRITEAEGRRGARVAS